MHPVATLFLTAALALSGVSQAQPPVPADTPTPDNVEQRIWRGTPIRIDLRLDTERTVRLPGATALRSGLLGGPVPGLQVQALRFDSSQHPAPSCGAVSLRGLTAGLDSVAKK